MELRIAPWNTPPYSEKLFRRAHDADPVRDVQRARRKRGNPGGVVSFRFETHARCTSEKEPVPQNGPCCRVLCRPTAVVSPASPVRGTAQQYLQQTAPSN